MNLLPQHFGRIVWSGHRAALRHEPKSSAETPQPQPDKTGRCPPAALTTPPVAVRRAEHTERPTSGAPSATHHSAAFESITSQAKPAARVKIAFHAEMSLG